ncbi:MAG: hypothetical protein N4A35_05320 [Flavobacteriales bacterium]|nr:hypothetical protein [Flavobacteriales bacterium]
MTLEKSSKLDLIRSFSKLTPKLILENQYPSLSKLRRTYGNQKVETVTRILLHDLSSSLKGELNNDEVEEINVEINSGYLLNLSLEDIYYTLRQIKTANNTRKLSVSKVLNAIEKQFETRTTLGAKLSLNKHLANKHIGLPDTTAMEKEKKKHKQAKEFYLLQQEIIKSTTQK